MPDRRLSDGRRRSAAARRHDAAGRRHRRTRGARFVGGTLSANPLSCAAGCFAMQGSERTNAAVKAGQAGDRLRKGLGEIIDRRAAYVAYNQARSSTCKTSGVLLSSTQQPSN